MGGEAEASPKEERETTAVDVEVGICGSESFQLNANFSASPHEPNTNVPQVMWWFFATEKIVNSNTSVLQKNLASLGLSIQEGSGIQDPWQGLQLTSA